jgi:hypothetical protein
MRDARRARCRHARLVCRILAFAVRPIVSVSVSIDGRRSRRARRSTDNDNLFVLPWNASVYLDEQLHEISVNIRVRDTSVRSANSCCLTRAQDIGNDTLQLKHEFSVSSDATSSSDQSNVILVVHWPSLVRRALVMCSSAGNGSL